MNLVLLLKNVCDNKHLYLRLKTCLIPLSNEQCTLIACQPVFRCHWCCDCFFSFPRSITRCSTVLPLFASIAFPLLFPISSNHQSLKFPGLAASSLAFSCRFIIYEPCLPLWIRWASNGDFGCVTSVMLTETERIHQQGNNQWGEKTQGFHKVILPWYQKNQHLNHHWKPENNRTRTMTTLRRNPIDLQEPDHPVLSCAMAEIVEGPAQAQWWNRTCNLVRKVVHTP